MSPRSKELSEKMRARSRKAIMDAALELFAKKGFSATTSYEIARKARVSKGLVFSYFSTKSGILLAIYDEGITRYMPDIGSIKGETPREKFQSLVDSWMNILYEEPLIVRLSLRLNLDEGWRKLLKRSGKEYMNQYMGKLKTLFAQLGSPNPALDVFLLGIFFDGITANYFVAPELVPVERVKKHFVEIMLEHWDRHAV